MKRYILIYDTESQYNSMIFDGTREQADNLALALSESHNVTVYVYATTGTYNIVKHTHTEQKFVERSYENV